MDKRKQIIHAWIESIYPNRAYKLESASSDASFRRYFRLIFADDSNNSYIVMDAPPEKEEIVTFCRIGWRFRQFGLNVPELIATDKQQGFVLMTDLGSEHYLDNLNAETADSLYNDALDSLITLQTRSSEERDFLSSYSSESLFKEMNLFREWYLPVHLKLQISPDENLIMDNAWKILIDSAQEQPQVWVHRDYHSRNLMVTAKNNPGIIDFQDAVSGPITYDLVSLLKDCYIEWPASQVDDWVRNFHRKAFQAGLLEVENEQQFLRWFHRMGIQRHLKVAGVFARLSYRDGKQQYINDLPLTMHYLLSALAKDEELNPLYQLIKEKTALL